jgi:hypothetical protein
MYMHILTLCAEVTRIAEETRSKKGYSGADALAGLND